MQKEFDFTRLSTFCTCERKYDLRINKGLVGEITAADFGHGIHKALDDWFVNKDPDKAVEIFKADFKENPEDSKRTHAIGEWILRNYHEQYKDQPWEVLEIEKIFDIRINDELYFIGRIDKIIKWDKTIWVVDHKTTSSLGPQFPKMAEPNGQFTGYVWAAKQLGYPAVGIIVDAMLVAKGLLEATRRKSLTPLLRYDSYRSDDAIREWLNDMYEVSNSIKECETSDLWVPTGQFNGACTYYGECPYRKVCQEDASLRERLLATDYKVEPWDPRRK